MELNVSSMGPRVPPNAVVSKDGPGGATVAVLQGAAGRNGVCPVTDPNLSAAAGAVHPYQPGAGLNGVAAGRMSATSLPPMRVAGVVAVGQQQQQPIGMSASPENNNNTINGSLYRAQQQSAADRRGAAGANEEHQTTPMMSTATPSSMRNCVSGGSPNAVGNGNASRTPGSGNADSVVDASPTAEDFQHHQPPAPPTHHQNLLQQQQQQQQQPHHQGHTQQQGHQQQQQATSTAHLQRCAACGREIADRFLLHAIDRYWHTECLRCSACQAPLADLGSTCFTRAGMTLCRPDYIRMFGLTGTCRACRQSIPPNEFVMKTHQDSAVYHVSCFACVTCHCRLVPGDRYGIVNGRLVCEQDYIKAVKNQLQQHPCQPLPPPSLPQVQLQGQPQQPQQMTRVDTALSRQHHKVC